jgi:hypothetical protein
MDQESFQDEMIDRMARMETKIDGILDYNGKREAACLLCSQSFQKQLDQLKDDVKANKAAITGLKIRAAEIAGGITVLGLGAYQGLSQLFGK